MGFGLGLGFSSWGRLRSQNGDKRGGSKEVLARLRVSTGGSEGVKDGDPADGDRVRPAGMSESSIEI